MIGTSPQDKARTSALCRAAEQQEEGTMYSSKGHFNNEDTCVFGATTGSVCLQLLLERLQVPL